MFNRLDYLSGQAKRHILTGAHLSFTKREQATKLFAHFDKKSDNTDRSISVFNTVTILYYTYEHYLYQFLKSLELANTASQTFMLIANETLSL